MKANRKFRDADNAVSAVIGVILMVAITVAIAATVYVYVSGMIGGESEKTPNIAFTKDNSDNILTVITADSAINWDDVKVVNGTGSAAQWAMHFSVTNATITAGDTLGTFTGDCTVQIMWVPTNTLIGTYEFTA